MPAFASDAVSQACRYGCSETDLMEFIGRKNAERGGFAKGLIYEGDE